MQLLFSCQEVTMNSRRFFAKLRRNQASLVVCAIFLTCVVWMLAAMGSLAPHIAKKPQTVEKRAIRQTFHKLGLRRREDGNATFPVNYKGKNETFTLMHSNPLACEVFDEEKEVFLLVLVTSHSSNGKRRKLFRETSGSVYEYRGKVIRTVFMLGLSHDEVNDDGLYDYIGDYGDEEDEETDEDGKRVNKGAKFQTKTENYKYRDIIQGNFVEQYSHLTLKTSIGLQWARTFCEKAKYVLKTDDDVVVNYKNVIDYLISVNQTSTLYAGVIPGVRQNYKDRIQQWRNDHDYEDDYEGEKKDSEELLNNLPNLVDRNKFNDRGQPSPPFCAGSGYVLSMQAVARMLAVAAAMPYTQFEDVFVGKLAKKLDIVPRDYFGFQEESTNLLYNACVFNNSIITVVSDSQQSFRQIWQEFKNAETSRDDCSWWITKTEDEKMSYIYKMLVGTRDRAPSGIRDIYNMRD